MAYSTEYGRAYRAKNRERLAQQKRAYYVANRGRFKAAAAANRRKAQAQRAAKRQALLSQQANRCDICGTDDPGAWGGWSLDHDHSCCVRRPCEKCRRSILCGACNLMLGYAKDRPAVLRAAADYLERWL